MSITINGKLETFQLDHAKVVHSLTLAFGDDPIMKQD